MKKLLVSIALASSALVAAAPASAQYYGRPGYDDRYDRYDRDGRYDRGIWQGNIRERLDRIAFRIDRGFERGALTRSEAQRLRWELNNVQRLAQRYSYDGLSGWERADLERRINWLQQRVQRERFDDDRRDWRY
jgi:hypothetical protein